MSKELTTEQKIMQATQYGLLIYAGLKCYNKVVTEVANKI